MSALYLEMDTANATSFWKNSSQISDKKNSDFKDQYVWFSPKFRQIKAPLKCSPPGKTFSYATGGA